MSDKTELDGSGLLIKTNEAGQVTGTAQTRFPGLPPASTMRAAIRKLSKNGEDYLVTLDNIARGNPFTRTLPPDEKGKIETFTVFPSLELQAHTANVLVQHLHGKPVAQTEVVRAEEQAQQLASRMNELQSLSTQDLMQRFEQVKQFLPVSSQVVIDVTPTPEVPPEAPKKNKGGRPKGSKNKPKTPEVQVPAPITSSIVQEPIQPTVMPTVPVQEPQNLMSAIQNTFGKKVGGV